ncbi:acyl dehydratase [Pseudomaricurvus alkylphenolicus]|uniref:bifunctional OB-fold nucleic acid binding domain-containing protein/MaoC family dehydratase n=1 Tax=Pseudomaricurvus alkylphenolicus TaxID=1306991 RepID=UPI001422091D|nr:OB-fold domain-containing protein [Pseudomaricurvus alkylphenolicus]NIB41010.1 acyl dehydratase [Pseudomaricurvus alkylphenolicus]
MNKPAPVATDTSAHYWKTLREHRVDIQQCNSCDHWIFYPRNHCPKCLSADLAWKTVSGEGTLYSYTLSRVPTAPEFGGELPQKLAVVQLDEGPRLNTTLLYLDEDRIEIGMRLKPVFEDREDCTLLHYTATSVEPPQCEPKVAEQSVVEAEAPMRQIAHNDIEGLKSLISDEFSPWSNPVVVTQELIDRFAELSGDDYWIHTDVEKAKKLSPFGGTIAQGALVQVLQSRFTVPQHYEVTGYTNMVNYGSDKLRFPSPVLAGNRIHMRNRVKAVEASSSGTRITLEMHTHVVGQDKPAVINEIVIGYM